MTGQSVAHDSFKQPTGGRISSQHCRHSDVRVTISIYSGGTVTRPFIDDHRLRQGHVSPNIGSYIHHHFRQTRLESALPEPSYSTIRSTNTNTGLIPPDISQLYFRPKSTQITAVIPSKLAIVRHTGSSEFRPCGVLGVGRWREGLVGCPRRGGGRRG